MIVQNSTHLSFPLPTHRIKKLLLYGSRLHKWCSDVIFMLFGKLPEGNNLSFFSSRTHVEKELHDIFWCGQLLWLSKAKTSSNNAILERLRRGFFFKTIKLQVLQLHFTRQGRRVCFSSSFNCYCNETDKFSRWIQGEFLRSSQPQSHFLFFYEY